MTQKYFTNTIESKLIKNILYNTSLPIYNTVRKGDYILAPFIYIYGCNLIRCTTSGIVGKTAVYTPLDHYTFGEYYSKFTYRYMSNSLYYDIDTHRKLGDYLRVYRDTYNINLMPFYNCWCNQYLSDYFIDKNGIHEGDSSSFKTLIVPIKFNRTYTIALDSSSNVYIAPIYLENNVKIKGWEGSKAIDLTNELCFRNERVNVHKELSTSFKKPFTICISNKDTDRHAVMHQRNEKYLYLAIQLLTTVKSTVIVLEGDYTNTQSSKEFNMPDWKELDPQKFDEAMLSNLDLLQFSNREQRPFSNRLIEYLLE